MLTPEQQTTCEEKGIALSAKQKEERFQMYLGPRGYFVSLDGLEVEEGLAFPVLHLEPAEIGYYHNGQAGPFVAGYLLPDGQVTQHLPGVELETNSR